MGGNSAHVIPLAWWAARGPDDQGLVLGLDSDIRILHRSTALAADTEVTGVIEGTSEHPGVAADSLIISNVANDGDILLLVSKAGNSQGVLWADGSSGDTAVMAASGASVDHYIAGTKVLDHAAGAFAFQENTTISSTGTLTMGAVTLSGAVAGGAQNWTNVGNITLAANKFIGGVSTGQTDFIGEAVTTYSSYLRIYGTDHASPGKLEIGTYPGGGAGPTARMTFTGALATDVLTWNAVYHVGLKYGLAGTATGAFTMDGATSGVVTVTVAAAAGTWTMTLPAAVGTAGYFLVDAAGNGITSWSNTLPAITLGGAVAGGDQAFTNVGDMTFAAGSIIASGATNGNTLILRANDTDFITFTTGATDACTLAGVTLSGTILASGTVTIPAITLGGAVAGGAQNWTNVGNITLAANKFIGCTASNAQIDFVAESSTTYSSYLRIYGTDHASFAGRLEIGTSNGASSTTARMTFTGVLATDVLTWNAVYHVGLKYGLAGTATGAFTMDGATSGVVTVTVAAAAGTWTMTLPATAGTSGQQLSTNGSGVCSWTDAASLRSLKNIVGEHSPQDALDKILHTRVYDFHYKEGKGTGDQDTLYTGIMAEDAPWAMHYNGGVVNPVNTLGFMVLGFQAHEERIQELERELAELKGRA